MDFLICVFCFILFVLQYAITIEFVKISTQSFSGCIQFVSDSVFGFIQFSVYNSITPLKINPLISLPIQAEW